MNASALRTSTAPATAFATVTPFGPSPALRRMVVGGVVALHLVLGMVFLQLKAVRETVTPRARGVWVAVVASPTRPAPGPVPALPAVAPVTAPVPAPPAAATRAPARPDAAAAVASPAPVDASTAAPAAAAEAAAPAALAALTATPAAEVSPAAVLPASPQATPAAPALIPPAAVQWLEQALPVYSPASARARESGRVTLYVRIDEAGLPGAIRIHQSSRFPRLDEACVAAMKKSRFKPYLVDGVPTAGYAYSPCEFEL